MRRTRTASRAPHRGLEAETPQERLAAFVARGRLSRLHGRTCPFDAPRWDVGPEVVRRSGVPSNPGPLYLSFAAVDAGPAELGAFVRAFLGQLPRSGHGSLQALAQAAGLLADAMDTRGVTSLAAVDVATLNAASALARERHSPARAARLGNAVLELGTFLHEGGMTRAPLVGAHRPSTPLPDLDRAGEVSADRRRRLLPSVRHLDSLAEAHRLAAHPADVVVTRVAAILLSAAARINEALALDEDPEVERTAEGVSFFGLRWHGSKGAPEGVKWVVPAMAPVARMACADLRRVTEEGRRMKRWYDAHPTALYLPPALAHLRGRAALTSGEVRALFGPLRLSMPSPAAIRTSFAEVEACLLTLLPARMRDAGGPASRPLMVVASGTFDGRARLRCPCMFETVKYRHVARALAGPLFLRMGLDAGEPTGGSTRTFRHHLVTAALRGGMSDADVAEWCGHASPGEVRTYDHRTAVEMRAMVDRASTVGRRLGSPLAPDWRECPTHRTGKPP